MNKIDADDQKRLDDIETAFIQWRKSRGNIRERIPSELLEMARSLTPVFSKSQICKRLNLSSSYLKSTHNEIDSGGTENSPPSGHSDPVFAEVALPEQPLSVEVHLPSGASVTLSHFTTMPPLALIQQLLGDAIC